MSVALAAGLYEFGRRKWGFPPAIKPARSNNEDKPNVEPSQSEPEPPPTAVLRGMTTADVMRIQGVPDEVSNSYRSLTTLKYGRSQFQIFDGRVTGWDNQGNLKLGLKTRSKATSFSLGSTQDDVLSAQGNPDQICWTEKEWVYGRRYGHCSKVTFEDKRIVSGWSIGDVQLKLTDTTPAKTEHPFTFGSTKAAVLDAQGSPLEVQDDGGQWNYKQGTVLFDEAGKVKAWSNNGDGRLNASL
ncbi:MAG TPA: hypothetical protein V6C81_11685 [Planktothrix sp.]